ncbi:MAG: YggT family protein [Acetobacteraceae bacterium]|nr:YggT family protein [Acetobacteraceae bacterium]
MTGLLLLLRVAVEVMFWLVLLRVVLSWVRPQGYQPAFYRLQHLLDRATEPLLGPIRRWVRPRAGLDWSPLVAMVLLGLLEALIIRLQG